MAKAREPLSDRALRALHPAPAGKRTELYDTDPKNLVVRVTDGGRVSFALMVRPAPGERATRRTLGTFGRVAADGPFVPAKGPNAITLAAARQRAKAWNLKFSGGADPREEQRAKVAARKAEEQRGIRFEVVAKAYLAAKVIGPDEENPIQRQATETKRIVDSFTETWGAKPIAAVTADMIEAKLERKAEDAPAMARNEFAALRALFNWASRRREYRPLANPCLSIDSRELLGGKKTRDRYLTDDELRLFFRNVRRLPYPFGPFYRLLALTGLRRSEVANAEWSEFDFPNGLWEIPASRVKNNRPHVVPLTPEIKALLESIREAMPRNSNAQFVFSTTAGEVPISGFSKVHNRLVKRMQKSLAALARMRRDERTLQIPHWTTHDIRRTVRTNLSALREVSHDTREAILSHVKPGVHGVYDRYDHLAEKSEALTLLATRLRNITEAPMGDLTRFVV